MKRINSFPKKVGNGLLLVVFVLSTVFSASFAERVLAGSPAEQSVAAPAKESSLLWNYDIVDGPPFYYFMTDRSLRFKGGTPCIAYGGDHLYYSCYNMVANSWQTKMVDDSVMVGSYASLDFGYDEISAKFYPFIAYYDGLNGDLKLAFNLSGNEFSVPWTILTIDSYPWMSATAPAVEHRSLETQDEVFSWVQENPWANPVTRLVPDSQSALWGPTADNGVGKHTSIAVDRLNQVHLSYYDEYLGALKYAFWNGVGAPQIDIVEDYHDQGDIGLWTSIDVDDNPFHSEIWPSISYMSEKYDDLHYARKKGDTWDIYIVDGGHNVGPFTSLVLDGDGRPHISYYDFSTDDLRYAKLNTDNKTWTIVTVDTNGDVGLFSSIARDGSGRYYISYYNRSSGVMKLAILSGTKWTIRTMLDNGNTGLYTSVAVGPLGPAVSCYNASLRTLEFIFYDSLMWRQASYLGFAEDVGQSTSLAISASGVPFISYLNSSLYMMKYAVAIGDAWSLNYFPTLHHAGTYSSVQYKNGHQPVIAYYDIDTNDLMYAEWTSTGWKISRVDSKYDMGQFVDLALDSSGDPHMSYYDATHGDLMYAYWNPAATAWITKTLDSGDNVGLYTSIAFDGVGRPAISYYDATNTMLKFAFKSIINAWVIQVVDSGIRADPIYPLHDVGMHSSLAFDGNSPKRPHIAYYDATDKDLLFETAIWDSVNFTWVWDPPVVVDGGGLGGTDVGEWASLAINQIAEVYHVCYYDATNGDLKYAWWNGGWNLEVVDSVGNVGQYCSIALNPVGLPGISYYDASMGDLKFVSLFTLSPAYNYYMALIKKK